MNLRNWLATVVAVGWVATGASAADKKLEYTFGTLKGVDAASAQAQAESWLKTTKGYDRASFDAIWADGSSPVLDRVAATLELGSPEAKAALADARGATAAAPKAVPALLKDDKADPFVRANLALAYAKRLSSARVYEESLEALRGVKADQVVDPAGYYFYRAVAEHALIKRDDAVRSIAKLLDEVADAPERYRVLASIMFVDVASWKKDDKDLGNIRRLMDNVERRLDLARGGKVTQDIQKKIVFRLDELIKEKEAKAGGGSGQGNGGNCPGGGQGNGPPGGNSSKSKSPAGDSVIMGGAGEGKATEAKLKNLAENWGKMPEAERAKAISDITRDLPPRYKAVIEDFLKSLSDKK